ncbi:tetratricopeptide repeat-containing serine protease family protein [Streptomyces sp. NPDC090301]|uniref:tetratricopeptide repeat-containing serine protease family protein n=1 Tax=Streptomyces sp. NPDC090301 TaxID=3154975 RepID=UPI003446F902
MEFDRRVQVRVVRKGRDARGLGSGYLVGPRLVLTADHVLDGLDPDGGPDTVTVCQPDTDEREYPATVLWRRCDETVDAALIAIDTDGDWPIPESLSDLLARPPQRYGRLIGTRSHPVTLTGFPRLQKDPHFGRLDEQLEGRITPGMGSLAGRYEITSTTPIPTPTHQTPAGTSWSGMSGAAVLSDNGYGNDLLCGIVRDDRQAKGTGTRLIATPISHLLTDHNGRPSDFRRIITEHTGWDPALEPLEPAPLLKPSAVDRDLDSPAALLRADTEAVTFHSRDNEIADLRTWCTDNDARISVRVYTGPGGQGKTRLARHLTDILSHENWITGHLRPDLTDAPPIDGNPPDLTTLDTALPLLLVIDYAETRPLLVRRLLMHLHTGRHRVRVLLLARADGTWRTDDTFRIPAPVHRLIKDAPVIALGPLQPAERTAQGRQSAFLDAARDLARLLPRVRSIPDHDWEALADSTQPEEDVGHLRFGNALTLQLAALVTLLQHGPRPATTAPGTPAEEILLEHEGHFWSDSANTPGFRLDLDTTTLRTAVAIAALCSAGSVEAATHVMRALPEVPDHKRRRAAAWLATLYPAEGDLYWGSLQPDRIAEYLITDVLAHQGFALPALLTAADPGQQAQSITVLARAAIAHYNAGRADSAHLTLRTLDAALDSVPIAHQALRAAAAALPYPSRIINSLALRLAGTLAQAEQERVHDAPGSEHPDLAASLSHLGTQLFDAGMRAEGLAYTERAVEIKEQLASDDPAHESDLAGYLSNLGIRLDGVGRAAEALATTDQAMEIFRRSVTGHSVAHEANLARILANRGIQLARIGRPVEALAATARSVEIRRRLAAGDPFAYDRELAGALSDLGIQLAAVGRREEALASSEEAVAIQRRLATDNPAAYESELADYLANLGNRLMQVERLEEALTVTREAVDIYRRLAADNPAAYEPALAGYLSNLGIELTRLGQQREALAVTEEAVEIQQRLATDSPAAHGPDLARSLTVLAQLLASDGHVAPALDATAEAVELYRPHIAGMPPLLLGLHETLSIQAQLLLRLGRQRQAAEIRRWLGENPLPLIPPT